MSTLHVPGDTRHPWPGLLRRAGRAAVERASWDVPEPPDPRSWLGAPGVVESELVEHERRLGVRLPPSYRGFLRVTDGWDGKGIACGPLLPVGRIGWVRDLDPQLVDIWSSQDDDLRPSDEDYFVYGEGQDTIHVRGEYVPDTLMIGEYDDGVYLLNPHIRTPDGEWEAWYMAPWLAGAERCRSFWDLMNSRLREYARPS
ncbi:SMI1/KNR4 family protein [Streptosporangium sandarakinum]|uniref:SMI1/KNR4 family protein n=1 Tax=Streptosporangium sandarakinum TaxID=1260955 RepID=UPI0036BBD588